MSILDVNVTKKANDEYIVTQLVEGVEIGFVYTRFDEVLEHLANIDEPISLKVDLCLL